MTQGFGSASCGQVPGGPVPCAAPDVWVSIVTSQQTLSGSAQTPEELSHLSPLRFGSRSPCVVTEALVSVSWGVLCTWPVVIPSGCVLQTTHG